MATFANGVPGLVRAGRLFRIQLFEQQIQLGGEIVHSAGIAHSLGRVVIQQLEGVLRPVEEVPRWEGVVLGPTEVVYIPVGAGLKQVIRLTFMRCPIDLR